MLTSPTTERDFIAVLGEGWPGRQAGAVDIEMTKTEHTPSEARTIDRYDVDSSNLKSIGYDESRRVLAIEFLSSRQVLHYDGFPPEKFEELSQSESRGKFYAKEIKGKYPARPMTGLCPKCGLLGYIGERCADCDGIVREIDRTHTQP